MALWGRSKIRCDICGNTFDSLQSHVSAWGARREARRSGWARTRDKEKGLLDICPQCRQPSLKQPRR
jgi:hypothetical protein